MDKTTRPFISLVVAVARNHAIGKNNQLLWHLPNDLKFFKKTTSGHTVIMGRKTFESIGKALPNRRNIVITRQPDYSAAQIEIVSSIEEAFALCQNENEIFVIGGAEIYKHTISMADRIYMTRVEADLPGDAFFPELPVDEWQTTYNEKHTPDEKHTYSYSFHILERKIKK